MKKVFLLIFLFLLIGCQTSPKLTPEEAKAKWQAPIAMSALNTGTCVGVKETAQKIQAEEIDGFEALGGIWGASLLIQVIEEGLAEAEPTEDQAEILAQIQADIDSLKEVVGPWINEETTSADVLLVIDDVCVGMEKTFEQVVEAAADDGLPPEEMEAILDEMSSAMESVTDELE